MKSDLRNIIASVALAASTALVPSIGLAGSGQINSLCVDDVARKILTIQKNDNSEHSKAGDLVYIDFIYGTRGEKYLRCFIDELRRKVGPNYRVDYGRHDDDVKWVYGVTKIK